MASGEYLLPHDHSNVSELPCKPKPKKNEGRHKLDARGRMISKPIKVRTKKQIKKLQNIVEKRKKKASRDAILDELQKYQLPNDEIKQFVSMANINVKPQKLDDMISSHQSSSLAPTTNSIRGSRKRKHTEKARPANVIPLSSSGTSESEIEDPPVEETKDIILEERHPTSITDKSPSCSPSISSVSASGGNGDIVQQSAKPNSFNATEQKIDSHQQNAAIPEQKTIYLAIHRTLAIESERSKLPIIGMEQEIVEAIKSTPVTIISGETGSGKTTQVPQFLYEAGFTEDILGKRSEDPGSVENSLGKRIGEPNSSRSARKRLIGITEPRRVAAISMAHRVGFEMNFGLDVVSYQIRYEQSVTDSTLIKFMTDGVLLREIQSDFLLTKYSVIIIDEAHERSMYSDILLGLLSRIVPLRDKRRDPLRLVIMSATLRVEDFMGDHLFRKKPVVINVESRQYPVTVYFNRVTPTDYVEEAYCKVCKIHRLLPEGAILVFVSGQQEIYSVIAKLKKTFPMKITNSRTDDHAADIPLSVSIKKAKKKKSKKFSKKPDDISLANYNVEDLVKPSLHPKDLNDHEIGEELALSDDEDFNITQSDVEKSISQQNPNDVPMYCLPLYSLLSSDHQARVFEPPPPGCRLCVVATNVAETSLTIPGVKYVVDTGKVKARLYNSSTVAGISRFEVQWVSQASANQRAGRAGRVGPGHCYRLYSSAVYSDFLTHAQPEIACKPVDELVLQMKAMAILKVINFPFPTPPDNHALLGAERRLVRLGALDASSNKDTIDVTSPDDVAVVALIKNPAKITAFGKQLAAFPLVPSFAKILVLAQAQDVLPYAVTLVSALSVRELLMNPGSTSTDSAAPIVPDSVQVHRWIKARQLWAADLMRSGHPFGDFGVLLKAVGAVEYAAGHGTLDLATFCQKLGLRMKAVVEVRKLRRQLISIIQLCRQSFMTSPVDSADPVNVDNPTGEQLSKKDFFSTVQLALDPDLAPPNLTQVANLQRVVLAGLGENVARRTDLDVDGRERLKGAYYCGNGLLDPVFIHPTSTLRKETPEWVVFGEIIDSGESGKKYMLNVMGIDPDWLADCCPRHCRLSEPLPDPCPAYDPAKNAVTCSVDVTFGARAWRLAKPARIKHPLDLTYYRIIASAFLAGELFPKLTKFAGKLLASPSIMMKTWARTERRVELLLTALVDRNIQGGLDIARVWATDREFLWPEYSDWLPEALHSRVLLLWPPLP